MLLRQWHLIALPFQSHRSSPVDWKRDNGSQMYSATEILMSNTARGDTAKR